MVSACTDVTGFGLAGHAAEMAAASGVTIAIDTDGAARSSKAPRAGGSEHLPGGGRTNAAHFGPRRPDRPGSVTPAMRLVCFDPQTSGGLLLAVDPGGHRRTCWAS